MKRIPALPAVHLLPFSEIEEEQTVLLVTSAHWDQCTLSANNRGLEVVYAVGGGLDCAQAAGRGDREGLKTLADCLAMEVQLCNQVGHARPEEGSEDYFAYAVETEMGYGLPHGDLVGPAILLFARFRGQDTSQFEEVLLACRIPLDHIPQDVLERTVHILPSYCRRHALPFGIAHTQVD